ncbi:hypothetical protein V2J09_019444, partial [Rumex salicifolius]
QIPTLIEKSSQSPLCALHSRSAGDIVPTRITISDLESCASNFALEGMSSQARNDRRHVRSNAHQQWMPRGSPVAQSPSSNSLNSSTNEPDDRTLVRVIGHRGNSLAPRTPNVQREGVSPSNINQPVQNRNCLQVGILGPRNVNRLSQIASSKTRRGRPPSHRRESKEREIMEKNESCDQGKQLMVMNMDVPQRVQEIQDKLTKGTLECMICCDRVKRSAPIWSCPSCCAIFHLSCTKKWACAPTSIDLVAEKSQGVNWRCPLCQSVQLIASKEIQYLCFCGKRKDPPSDPYLTPHSCGEPCGKSLEKQQQQQQPSGSDDSNDVLCPHVCVLQCHPGPCPPCKAFAPPRVCPCGKKVLTSRCSDQKAVLTCGQVCEKQLECQRHICEQTCHLGPCDPCDVQVTASCFCMKKTESILCGEIAVKGEVDMNSGLFSCISTCGKKFACGNHFCGEVCHPGPCGECELLPSRIKTCHCGKTSLQGNKRASCLDPIPTCTKTCGKLLSCKAHHCKEVCHEGDCPPCLEQVTQKCRCGSTSRTVECYRSTSSADRFVCEKPCGQKKNCGRHRCSERCCPLSSPRSTLNGDWNPHLCSIVCGKKLRCGQHSCQSLCHSGHCTPCHETIFSELTCSCGRTSIPPPLPCGTPLPSCQHPCSVPQQCGHQPSHSCHFGDCPPCPIPVAKECVGGHVILRNIPCGSKDIKCNKLCGKTMQCGIHACSRACHSGPCYSQSGFKASCGQACGALRRDCRHTCTSPCHPLTPCPDLRCEFPVTITCSCGRLTAQVPCDSEDQRKLTCDEECLKAERKRVLADAFDIKPPNLDALHFGENHGVSEDLKDFFRRDPKWVISVEERFKHMVMGKNRVGNNNNNMRVHVFCPMMKEKREVVRLMAERWKLTVSSAGWEPRRFVVVHVTPKSKAPARMMGGGGGSGKGLGQPLFDPLVDMDPRLVVCLFELPNDADISALVLRFGGECELVWLNDKNALAVFNDHARAATAMRRLDRGSVYHGAAAVAQQTRPVVGVKSGANAWRGVDRTDPWKKVVVRESNSWGEEEEEIVGCSSSGQDSNKMAVMETPELMISADEVADDWEKVYA